MSEHKYISKSSRWVSNGNGGKKLITTYKYNRVRTVDFGLGLLFMLCALPFLIVKNTKTRMRIKRKSLADRLKENHEQTLEKIHQMRCKLWGILKEKRKNEDDIHWNKRLKRYGFTKDGTHIKTGINYESVAKGRLNI